jgi:ABC-type nitrate/sulfonate/bicarbonate transport system substrate-binding protein
MGRVHGRRRLVLTALAFALATACAVQGPPARGPAAAPPPAAGAPTGAGPLPGPAEPPPLTALSLVYSTTSSANSLIRLAQDEGLFRANHLEVETVYAPGNAGPAALLTGQAQVMVTGCTEALSAIAGGADLVYVLVNTNRLQYVLAGGPTVQSRDDLRGKRLGVSRLGTSSHLSTKFILKYLGLDPERDAAYIQVGNSPERVSALLAGSIDGSILTIEEALVLADTPGIRILVDMTAEAVPYCGNGWFMQRQYVRDHADIVRRLTRAMVEATARFKLNQAEGVGAVMRFLDESDAQRAERIWTVRARMFPAKPYPEPQGFQFVLDEVAQDDPRAREIVPERIIDARFVRELDESGYIDRLYPGGVAPTG